MLIAGETIYANEDHATYTAAFIEPNGMLATEWTYETKLDGYRLEVVRSGPLAFPDKLPLAQRLPTGRCTHLALNTEHWAFPSCRLHGRYPETGF